MSKFKFNLFTPIKLDEEDKSKYYKISAPSFPALSTFAATNPPSRTIQVEEVDEYDPWFKLSQLQASTPESIEGIDDMEKAEESYVFTDKKTWASQLAQAYRNAGVRNEATIKLLLAQDDLESSGGTSSLAKYGNFGGITTGSGYKGKSVRKQDKDKYGNPKMQTFRVYASMDDYAKDKISLLRRRYDFKEGDDADTFISKLLGNNSSKYVYAEDPEYGIKLKSKINAFKLGGLIPKALTGTYPGFWDSTDEVEAKSTGKLDIKALMSDPEFKKNHNLYINQNNLAIANDSLIGRKANNAQIASVLTQIISESGGETKPHGNGAYGLIGWRGARANGLPKTLSGQLHTLMKGLFESPKDWTHGGAGTNINSGKEMQQFFKDGAYNNTRKATNAVMKGYVRPPVDQYDKRHALAQIVRKYIK